MTHTQTGFLPKYFPFRAESSHDRTRLQIKFHNFICSSMSLQLFHCLNLRQDNEQRLLHASPWGTTGLANRDSVDNQVTAFDSSHTYRSIWVSLRSARWSGRTWCPVQRGECAASHRGRSRRPCQPATGTPAAAPLEGWWSRTLAGQCCCTHLNITQQTHQVKGGDAESAATIDDEINEQEW